MSFTLQNWTYQAPTDWLLTKVLLKLYYLSLPSFNSTEIYPIPGVRCVLAFPSLFLSYSCYVSGPSFGRPETRSQ